MLEDYLDEMRPGRFFDGLQSYLTKHKYGNAVTRQLWEALDDGTLRIAEIMSSWTDQSGYPIVKLEEPQDTKSVVLSQERYFRAKLLSDELINEVLDGSGIPKTVFEKNEQKWIIPVFYRVFRFDPATNCWGKPKNGSALLSKEKVVVSLDSSVDLLFVNPGHFGVYHTGYSEEQWNKIQGALKCNSNLFTPLDKAGLVM